MNNNTLPYFIVFDKETGTPLAVGEAISSETAKYCVSIQTGIFFKDLVAEEMFDEITN